MNQILLILFFLITANSNCQVGDFNPPGTIQVQKDFFIDSNPVTNMMFLEYLNSKAYMKKYGFDSFEEFQEDYPEEADKALILKYPGLLKNLQPAGNESKINAYFTKNDYKNSPVLSISYDQAEDFCKWRTEMVQLLWLKKEMGPIKNNVAERISYRLPTEKEWDKAKNAFRNRDKLNFIKVKNPLRFKNVVTDLDNMNIYPIQEYSASDSISKKVTEIKKTYTGFRCVCEIL